MEREILKAHKVIIDKAKEVLDELFARNPIFNEYIDQLPPYDFKNSEYLFYTTIDTYLEELDDWRKNRSKEENSNLLTFIGIEGQSTLQELIQGIQRKRIAPFVGAGLCAPLGFPSWSQALKEVRAKFDDIDLHEVDVLIADNKYLEAAQVLHQQDDSTLINFVSDRFIINPNYTQQDVFIGALQYLPEIAHGCVITTNFDKSLEKVFELSGKSFQGFMRGIQPLTTFVKDLIKGERCLLKLHGSVGEVDSYIFTLNQYDAAYGNPFLFENPLPKTLRQIYISHSLLFLGCSLEKDKTLELFQKIKQDGEFEIPQHFAILPKPATNALKRDKERELRNINIKTIWYPAGEHEYVEKILKLAIDAANNRIKFKF